MESHMYYDKMDALITTLEEQKGKIENILSVLTDDIPPKIADAYNGEAATAYKNAVTKEANHVKDVVQEMIVSLKTKIEENKAGYIAQDAKMADSVTVSGN